MNIHQKVIDDRNVFYYYSTSENVSSLTLIIRSIRIFDEKKKMKQFKFQVHQSIKQFK